VTVRFLADEDLDSDIVSGLLSCEPSVDILDIKNAGLRGSKYPVLLELAAEQDRILITHDRRTMTRYFYERMAAAQSSPGVFIVPQSGAIGDIIECLLLVWTASKPEEWRNQIVYLPFR